ncbi:hypothetical protein MGYG_01577 [Nannizzia gypsea CBS 118893]|uniref:Uncharacterized protein n=1 Tax=Arthroderma gypseum (strain ATCC MYA-4604 / CBS 118893) TaxID=535722 RepID=E5R1R6_ARTGP|nr:hypothetical protein MGYG_01577 [Nannizzia gypsea CBS 118893]EFQ98550.1 hypothetical protein MGYG_01577 [Nannizzia gypsea CBS 118893]
MAPRIQDLYTKGAANSDNHNHNGRSLPSASSSFSRIGRDTALGPRQLHAITKRTQMINIPAIYSGPHTSPPIVVAIVLGTVIGFVLVAYVLYIVLNKPKDIMSASSDVVSENIRRPRRKGPPRRKPTKPAARKKPIIVDEDEPEPYFVDVQDTSGHRHEHAPSGYGETESLGYTEETSESHYHHAPRSKYSQEMAESYYDPSPSGRR